MFLTKILWEGGSKFNKNIKVVKTFGIGTYIQVDGLTQSGGIITTIWKPILSKIRNSKFEIRKMLVLGLGGGTVAKLARKNWPNAKITGVEIDPVMIELGRKYLDLDKYDVNIKIQDARKFRFDKKYDLIVVDSYIGDRVIDITRFNPVMGKVWIFNRLYYGDKKQETAKFGEKLKKIFKKVEVFYPPANVMFVCS